MKYILLVPVKHWPRSISPLSREAPVGDVVDLVHAASATLLHVCLADGNGASDSADIFPVLASQVRAIEPAA